MNINKSRKYIRFSISFQFRNLEKMHFIFIHLHVCLKTLCLYILIMLFEKKIIFKYFFIQQKWLIRVTFIMDRNIKEY